MSGCGADELANTIFEEVLDGADFTLPTVDLTPFTQPVPGTLDDPIVRITNADLTQQIVDGTGTFDILMKAARAHLQLEFEKSRINGAEYAKVYIAMTEMAMSQGVQFLIARDAAYWQAVTAQQQALAAQAQVIIARVQLETSKVQLQAIRAEALTNQASYALTKMKLSTESIGYCIAKYNLDNMLPAQLAMVNEQKEAQRAQTMDTRSDGITPVNGQVGKQKELYDQQITSYRRDSEVKVAKLFTDAWITMKTIDEGVLPPDGFENANLDIILNRLQVVNDLDS